MTVFRFYVPASEVPGPETIVGDFELLEVTKTRIVGKLDDVVYGQIYGAFSFSSPRAFANSRIDRLVLSTDQEGLSPLFAMERVNETFASLMANPYALFDGDDLFLGSPGDDALTFFEAPEAGRGNDTLRGGGGDDALHGGIGADKLFGEEGADTLYLGPGKDRAAGGSGPDLFVLLGDSRGSAIEDFDAALGDRLELRAAELFTDPDAARADPADFVRITGRGTKNTLFLDADGGGDRFVKWATVKGDLGATDLDSLLAEGTLVIG